ncbi:hypothetical protein [Halomarina litorea]|uniref:hypothetical protein n=1 Tax=Halomarina litorea TaxID=2961595 RepID=UPI0020C5A314|nr:hypothetical protein [Halomarina sp. BCD28]
MTDTTPTDSGDPHADRPDPGRPVEPTRPAGPDDHGDHPADRARYLLAATALSLARLAFVSAVPLVTLCLLVGVEALVGAVPTMVVTTASGEYAVPLTQALAFAVVAHLARRLYALNAG